jgi:hypothetical protein
MAPICISGCKKKGLADVGIFARREAKINEFLTLLVMLYMSIEYVMITAINMTYADKDNAFGSYPVSNCGSK